MAQSKSLLWLGTSSSIIKCFNICQGRRGRRIKRKSAKIRPGCSNPESQVKRNGGDIRREESLSFLMGGVFGVSRDGLKRCFTGSIKAGTLITTHICAHPMVRLIWDLRTGKPAALWLEAVDTNGIFRQIELTTKEWTSRTLCIKIGSGQINNV